MIKKTRLQSVSSEMRPRPIQESAETDRELRTGSFFDRRERSKTILGRSDEQFRRGKPIIPGIR